MIKLLLLLTSALNLLTLSSGEYPAHCHRFSLTGSLEPTQVACWITC